MTANASQNGARRRGRAFSMSNLKVKLRKIVQDPRWRILKPPISKVLAVMRPSRIVRVLASPPSINTPKESITVISANLWHDWPLRRKLWGRMESFAQLIEAEGADVVLLQEVVRSTSLNVDDWLAERLGMGFVYSRANGDGDAIGFEEGLAVFSRYPLSAPRVITLGEWDGLTRRIALAAEINSPFGALLVISVHLGLIPRKNVRQWDDLRTWVTDMSGGRTTLIGGDFNAHEKTHQVYRAQHEWVDTFRTIHPDVDGTTHGFQWPWGGSWLRRRLDYIFLRQGNEPLAVADAKHIQAPLEAHSDHRAVVARLMYGK
ncbi:MAG: hypothetical protein GTO18_05995 [Anaerolineales bacterium]|nr:hypothetical protein [Anaerolineales bacterium]